MLEYGAVYGAMQAAVNGLMYDPMYELFVYMFCVFVGNDRD